MSEIKAIAGFEVRLNPALEPGTLVIMQSETELEFVTRVQAGEESADVMAALLKAKRVLVITGLDQVGQPKEETDAGPTSDDEDTGVGPGDAGPRGGADPGADEDAADADELASRRAGRSDPGGDPRPN